MAIEAILTGGTGQWMDSSDGQHFWFDSGSLALDFSYTGGLDRDGGEWQTVHDAKELNDWLTTRFPEVAPTAGDREFRDASALGSAIGRLARQQSGGATLGPDDVDVVNLFAATPDIPPVLAGGGRQAGRTNARPHQALSTIARDAVRLFSAEADGRIRECSADDCDLVYLDTSRSGNRRWCSMQRCGNRAKVRAHRARAAASAPPASA
ncbi:CGNR zinc finger domain-containing protein [Leifsonia sp. PS1209]|uniref:CGNR zinc finger domain-containing protein n=1 Tax=Leifsonia sp. PS1209 TaxID=2724914 RepID=UPI001FF7EA07|nr:CGNR zinc finger domain-containing protein [Leifsonia sp. PS1209]